MPKEPPRIIRVVVHTTTRIIRAPFTTPKSTAT